MWGLSQRPLWVRLLAGAVWLAGLVMLWFICLIGFAFAGGGVMPGAWVYPLVGIAAGLFTVAFFMQRARAWTAGAAAAVTLATMGLAGWNEWQVRQEATYLRISAAEPQMHTYRPRPDNPRLARLSGPASLQWGAEQLPRMDGATALYPLYAAFTAAVWPTVAAEVLAERVQVNKTSVAYERLLARETDIAFVAGPSKAQVASAKAAGVDLHLTPIGREAFVFYVAANNPVRQLSREQIRSIYTGKIRNWAQVGARAGKIIAFQRPEGSGSQSMLQKIMGETPLMPALTHHVVQGMGGVVQQTRDYTNYPGAIGYSFRVFVTRMLEAGDIHLLAVDGVAPTPATIADGSYPLATEFYAATLGPPQGDTKRFIDWIRSAQGQTLVERTGYVGLLGR
ncbi:MAG: substrate-binding domain-containing protein [Ideonella sp.]|nr:substrate-binding domain-containing protein [Ideonella sp.]